MFKACSDTGRKVALEQGSLERGQETSDGGLTGGTYFVNILSMAKALSLLVEPPGNTCFLGDELIIRSL